MTMRTISTVVIEEDFSLSGAWGGKAFFCCGTTGCWGLVIGAVFVGVWDGFSGASFRKGLVEDRPEDEAAFLLPAKGFDWAGRADGFCCCAEGLRSSCIVWMKPFKAEPSIPAGLEFLFDGLNIFLFWYKK